MSIPEEKELLDQSVSEQVRTPLNKASRKIPEMALKI
jgi:hypothetical protein